MAGISDPIHPSPIRDARPAPRSVPSSGVVGWINRLRLTARWYEPLWRHRSLALLTRGTFSTARELDTMRVWGAPIANAVVLDLGCSAGLYARTLAAHGAQVSALDQSAAFLREGARRAAAVGVSVDWVLGDAHALPFADASFDLVVIGASLNEFADPPRAFAEIARVLRPEGRLWLMYARQARGLGRVLQVLLALGTLRFPDPLAVNAWAAAVGMHRARAEERGPVALALYRLGAPAAVRSAGERTLISPSAR